MKDIRNFIEPITPLIFKDKIHIIYVPHEQYVVYSLNDIVIYAIYDKIVQNIDMNIIPAIAITTAKIEEKDYLIAWFDNNALKTQNIHEIYQTYIGILTDKEKCQEIVFLDEITDISNYFYQKSKEPIEEIIIKNLIKNDVAMLDRLSLNLYSDYKLTIPPEMKSIDQTNIRIALFEISKFGGNTVIPFVWCEKSNLNYIIKEEKLNDSSHYQTFS